MYKSAAILYVVCFFCYVLFSRIPDYFDGDFTAGTVAKAVFSVKDRHPVLVIDYKVENVKFTYTTTAWFLTSYKKGQVITMIYNPSHPGVASIYALIGYWIKWGELFFTALVFIILFIVAVIITGKNRTLSPAQKPNRKRKYDDDDE